MNKVCRIPLATLICCLAFIGSFKLTNANKWSAEEETSEYWNSVGQDLLAGVLDRVKGGNRPAKNVILFMGDGMSLSTITAGRILKGQLQGQPGEETATILSKFQNVGLSKIYSVDKQSPDSASTGTAILTGVKTKSKLIGVNGRATAGDCQSSKGAEVESILEASAKDGKATGIVTTTEVQHSSPAAAYAHAAHRFWMSDGRMSTTAKSQGCKDIALQLFEKKQNLNVVLGGGRSHMRSSNDRDEEYQTPGLRTDKRNLIQEWVSTMPSLKSKYVWDKTGFDKVDPQTTDHLLGLFAPYSMKYDHERQSDTAGEPSLSEMTEKAIQVLQKNKKGYFLFVEGGKIDHAHHSNKAHIALTEFLAFEKAIETAVSMTSEEETLIIVTADHGQGFTLGGYADRGNPVHGFARSHLRPWAGRDGKRYTAITYANGPGHQGTTAGVGRRENPTYSQIKNPNYQFQSAVPTKTSTHSADDTVVLARGPMSRLFSGTFEQNYIAHAMRYASCVGPDKSLCSEQSTIKKEPEEPKPTESSKPQMPDPANCTVTKETDNGNLILDKVQVTLLLAEVNEKINELLGKVKVLRQLQM